MHRFSNFSTFIFSVFLFASAPAWADRPAWAGGHKGDENGRSGGKNWSNGKNEQDYRGYQDNPGRNASQQGNRNYQAAIMRYVISIICNEALFMIISGHNSEVGAVRQVWRKSTTAASLQDRRNNGG